MALNGDGHGVGYLTLTTVLTFVSVYMFCASRFTLRMRAKFGIDIINYANKRMTKMKATFSYCDQIKFNEPAVKPGIPEKQHIAKH